MPEKELVTVEGIVERIGIAQRYHALATFMLLEGSFEPITFGNPDIMGSDDGWRNASFESVRALALTVAGDKVRIVWCVTKGLFGKKEQYPVSFENDTLQERLKAPAG